MRPPQRFNFEKTLFSGLVAMMGVNPWLASAANAVEAASKTPSEDGTCPPLPLQLKDCRPYNWPPGIDTEAPQYIRDHKHDLVANELCIAPDGTPNIRFERDPDLSHNGQHTPYKNTAIHFHAINHHWPETRYLLNTFPKQREALATATDVNGRTPLMLALGTAAPSDITKKLTTKESAVLADKNSVTPLMMASMGASTSVVEKLITLIGKDNLAEQLAKKDNEGRTANDYSKLKRNDITKVFKDYAVNGRRACNHPTDAFLGTCRRQFDWKLQRGETSSQFTKRAKEELGLQLGVVSVGRGSKQLEVLATPGNLEALKNLGKEPTPLKKFFGKSAFAQVKNEILPSCINELNKIEDGALSPVSLSESLVQNRKAWPHALKEQLRGPQRDGREL